MHSPEPQILVFDAGTTFDARMYAAAVFRPTKKTLPGVKMAAASTKAKVEGKELTFPVPSHAALCLNISQLAFEKFKSFELDHAFEKKSYGNVSEEKLFLLYELFEQLISNTVFACTALEAFCNQVIPDEYIYVKKRQDKKCSESYTKDQIERFVTLDEKLSEVLPLITGSKFKKGGSLWNDYYNMRRTRDRIIHVKSSDLGVKDGDGRSIWEDLLKRRKIDCSIIAHKVMKVYKLEVDHSESPVASGRNQWINYFPFNHS